MGVGEEQEPGGGDAGTLFCFHLLGRFPLPKHKKRATI